MTIDMLFDGYPDPEPVIPPLPEGAGRCATQTHQQRQKLARGVHPATGLPLLGVDGATCGGCVHLWAKTCGSFHGWKCDLAAGRNNDGPDMRKHWPACTQWQPKP